MKGQKGSYVAALLFKKGSEVYQTIIKLDSHKIN